MKEVFFKVKNSKRIIWMIKILVCICVLFLLFKALFVNGLKPYYSYKDYNYQNDFSEEQVSSLDGVTQIEQYFTSKGNIIDGITLYLGDLADREIKVSVYPAGESEIASTIISSSGYSSHVWNKLSGFTVRNLERDKEYVICLSCENGLSGIVVSSGDAPIIFNECSADGNQIDGHIAAGIQFTYCYMTLGSFFEMLIAVVLTLLMGLAMCYSIFNIEKLLGKFLGSKEREGFLTALYFSVSSVLLYNPLEAISIEVSKFSRVIGAGLIANVDVSKRTGNFNHWFILFAAAFVLFYLLSNSIFKKDMTEDAKKVAGFIKNYMVLANCCLLLRIITYFNDETASTNTVYYFTSYVVMIVALIGICYIVLNLDKKVSLKNYLRLNVTGLAISLPFAIFIALEWGKGRVLLGVWFIISILIILYCKFLISDSFEKKMERPLGYVAIYAALLPLLTSLYIEVIHVMNQNEVFVAHPLKYYKIAIVLYIIVVIATIAGTKKKDINLDKISKWAVPMFIFGVSCLSIQMPISSTYKPDLFEGANYSILISDFLNFGTIPIVQHYGGHMMTSVWEGIIYGIINGDYYGAAVSPYSSIILPFLIVLFYYLVEEVWDEKQAVFAALLFPFYDFWSYYGLGMLTCVAAIAYIRKNTYVRAILLWGAFVWCAIYRLDLGFAFGLALIFSMITYVLATKNWKVAKQLGISLAGWGVAGSLIWFIICIIKGVNPINRLIEFLMINLSNQNWAYAEIGNVANILFGWSYIVIPFLVTLALLYTTFSKTMRERIGMGKWILLLIMGWSYFGNFSRGLVRHSLAETETTIVIWSGYLFLAMFISAYKNEARWFLPSFMVLILCNTLFVQDGNFASAAIAENAMNQPTAIIESWERTRFSEEEYAEAKLAQDRLIAHGGTVDEETRLPDYYMTYWEQVKYENEKVQRVELDNDLFRYVKKYETVIGTLLKDDETFVDFINKTLIYSLLERENPVYISQSPLQLSGEFTQTEFIKEIAGVPIVLMPIDADNYWLSNSLDGITNLYRNYKVGEYIFQNYTPLCQYGNDYVVWCLNDRKKIYTEKIKTLRAQTPVKLIDYGYDGPIANTDAAGNITYSFINALHNHTIGQLPRIWAEGDKKKAVENTVAAETSYIDGLFVFDPVAIEKKNGNYCKIALSYDGLDNNGLYENDDEQLAAAVIMGKYENGVFEEKCRYNLSLKEGRYNYLIRCSTDYYWYLNQINALRIQTDGKVYDVGVNILEGD